MEKNSNNRTDTPANTGDKGLPKQAGAKGKVEAEAKDTATDTPTAVSTETSTVTIPTYRDADMLQVQTFEDALNLMIETYGSDGVITADEVLGNGFGLLSNKDLLCGVPFLCMKWQFYPGKFADNFVTIMVVTQKGEKYLVNDGSTGLCKQLWELTQNTGRQGGMVARHGLTRSDFTYLDENNVEKPASTFYIDTSAL